MVMVDSIVNACVELYKKLPKTGKPCSNEWTAISAVVGVLNSSEIKVLSLGTGSKCIGKSLMSSNGDILNDSHAEVIARRAFLKYLYLEIIRLNTTHFSEVLYEENNKFYVKNSVKLYFVTGMSPCGDASIMPKPKSCQEDVDFFIGPCVENALEEAGPSELKRVHSQNNFNCKRIKVQTIEEEEKIMEDIHRTGAKCLPQSVIQDKHCSGLFYHNIGAVRTKPGRGDPTLSLSCSDKIARWNAVGWEGALLSIFFESPIFIEAIICGGSCPFSEKSFTRAVNERINRKNIIPIHQSHVTFPNIKGEGKRSNHSSIIWCNCGGKETEVSINGRKLGVTKKNLIKKLARTSICKKELFILFEKAVNSLRNKDKFIRDQIGLLHSNSLKYISYGELKSRAVRYQSEWSKIKENCFKVWSNKPKNLLDFTLKEPEE